jgi:RNase P subunit RPR2
MTTPVSRRQDVRSPQLSTHHSNEWRCSHCDKLLGICRDGRLHLRFGRGHEYFVSFPVVATCRGCGTLNQATAPLQR